MSKKNFVRFKIGNYIAVCHGRAIEVKAKNFAEARLKAVEYFDSKDVAVAPVPEIVGIL